MPEGLEEGDWVGAVVEELGAKEGDAVTGALVGDDVTGAFEGALVEIGAKEGEDVTGVFEGALVETGARDGNPVGAPANVGQVPPLYLNWIKPLLGVKVEHAVLYPQ